MSNNHQDFEFPQINMPRVVDTTEAPTAKTSSKLSANKKISAPVAPKFEIAHSKLINMQVFANAIGLAVAQGVLAKVQAETGLPTWEIYWVAIAAITLAGIGVSSKTGNQSLFIFMMRLAIAVPCAPALAWLLMTVFGGGHA